EDGIRDFHVTGVQTCALPIFAFVLLALLPLLLRRWRGETAQDRRLAADTIRDRAERTADAAIAVKRAEVRTEAELLRADQQLTRSEERRVGKEGRWRGAPQQA